MSRVCNGDGSCLTQTDDCNTYAKDPEFTCEYNCSPKLCGNYVICGTISPEWLLRIRSRCVCMSCDMQFRKKLDIIESIECPLCFEIKKCVVQPNCNHATCVDCFKRCMYGEPSEDYPQFPYSKEIEDMYDEELSNTSNLDNTDEFDAKWKRDYPLVQKWERDCEQWHDDKDLKYHNEENLRKCPICRQ